MVQKSEELDLLVTKYRSASCQGSFGRVFATINLLTDVYAACLLRFQARRDL